MLTDKSYRHFDLAVQGVQFLPQGLRQGGHGELGGRVHVQVRHLRNVMAQHAVDVYHVAVDLVGQHPLHGLPCRDRQSEHVGVEDFLPVGGGSVDQGLGAGDSGVVDQDVDRAQFGGDRLEGPEDVLLVGDVAADGDELALSGA